MADVPQFALESVEAVRTAGIDQLSARHYDEIAHFKDIPLEVDWPSYAAVEAAGKLRIFTARIAGELVGYVFYVVGSNPHYMSLFQALQDVLFLAPEHRGSRIGIHLVRFSEARLRAEGVRMVCQHTKVKPGLDLGPMFASEGYELVDTVWAKRLDREGG